METLTPNTQTQSQNVDMTEQIYTPPTEFNFNFGRLVKEVDALVQNKTKEAVRSIDTNLSITLNNLEQSVEKAKENFKTDYTNESKRILESIREDLINVIEQGRTVININNLTSVSVSHQDHHQFEDIMKTLLQLKKVMMIGKAGTGKTYMAAQFAERLNLPFYKYSASRDSSVHDLLGYKQPRSEEYLETTFLRAYEYGGVFLVDEFDAMSSDMALFFNGVADNSPNISIPHRDTKPVAEKHKDFYLVFSGNTWGTGSIDYTGRDFQDLALLDRFRIARHDVGYHTQFEKSVTSTVSPYLYSMVCKLRESLENIGNYLSTRNIEDLVIITRTEAASTNIDINNMSTCKQVFKSSVKRLLYDLEPEVRNNILNSI